MAEGIDDDSKARRNLVFASGAVLLAGWLHLPLPDIAERVLGIKAPAAIDPCRAWAAVVAVLLYLALRFTYSDDNQAARDAFGADWLAQRQAWQRRILTWHLKRAAAGGKDSALFDHKLTEFFEHVCRVNGIDRSKGDFIRLQANGVSMDFVLTWSGTASIDWHAQRADGGMIKATDDGLPYNFGSVAQRMQVRAVAGFIVLARSKTTSVAVAPAVLALAAMFCAAYQLGTAWLKLG